MKTGPLMLHAAAAVCVLGLVLPRPAAAAVSDEDFKALKDTVDKLTKQHAEDQQKIQQLQQKMDGIVSAPQVQPKGGAVSPEAFDALKSSVDNLSQQMSGPARGPFALQDFMIVGDGEAGFTKTQGQHGAFALADFAPIFLFRASDKVLFEAGFDMVLQNGGTPPENSGHTLAMDLSFAQLDYVLNQYATIVAGYMVLPLGTYSERGAGWLNKIPDDPFARDILPGAGAGLQVRGAIPVDNRGQTITYAAYVVNGPSSIDTTGHAGSLDLEGNVGILSDGGTASNLHGSPSAGGRIGWFCPWGAPENRDNIEIGLSGQEGVWSNSENGLWKAAVVDAALHLGPNFELKGEYINTWVGTDDHGTIHPRGLWAQLGYKLAGLNLDLPLINNIELVTRFDDVRDPVGMLGTRIERYTFGYVYYFTNTLQFKGDYELINSNDHSLSANQWLFQLSYGF